MTNSTDYSRRIFLRALGISAAGLTLGGGAAWAQGQLAEQASLTEALRAAQSQLAAAQGSHQALDLSYTTLQGQLATLDTQLAAATSQNSQLAGALSTTQQEADALRAQLSEAQTQLADATSRLGRYRDLIGLYDQLEGLGLDALTQNGLSSAAAGIAGASGLVPVLRGGLETARGLLDEFERVLPDFHAGLSWLGEQVIQLKLGLYALEKAGRQLLADAAVGAAATFGGFIKFVLNALPFDIGEKVRATFSASQALIAQSAGLAGEADQRVFEKMARYVSGGPHSWQARLVAPLRQETLGSADALAAAVAQAEGAFQGQLQAPVQATLAQRAAVREQIAAYRATHQL